MLEGASLPGLCSMQENQLNHPQKVMANPLFKNLQNLCVNYVIAK